MPGIGRDRKIISVSVIERRESKQSGRNEKVRVTLKKSDEPL